MAKLTITLEGELGSLSSPEAINTKVFAIVTDRDEQFFIEGLTTSQVEAEKICLKARIDNEIMFGGKYFHTYITCGEGTKLDVLDF